MRRFATLALLTLCVPFAAAQNARRQLVAHEWGVWLIEGGQPTVEALARECPPWVVRAAAAPTSLPPRLPARKPVLFLRSDTPIPDLTVEVRFEGGRPWLLYPTGQVLGDRIVWRGDLTSRAERRALAPRAGQEPPARRNARGRVFPRPPPAPPGHWWNRLREVDASMFLSRFDDSESFLFYDGPVHFRSPIRASRLRSEQGEHTVWVVGGSSVVEHRVSPNDSRVVRRGDKHALRRWLLQAATSAGLEPDEARSLVETWQGELFGATERRAIYFIPRSDYDRMLPITITPTPTELVRVGLVIEKL